MLKVVLNTACPIIRQLAVNFANWKNKSIGWKEIVRRILFYLFYFILFIITLFQEPMGSNVMNVTDGRSESLMEVR